MYTITLKSPWNKDKEVSQADRCSVLLYHYLSKQFTKPEDFTTLNLYYYIIKYFIEDVSDKHIVEMWAKEIITQRINDLGVVPAGAKKRKSDELKAVQEKITKDSELIQSEEKTLVYTEQAKFIVFDMDELIGKNIHTPELEQSTIKFQGGGYDDLKKLIEKINDKILITGKILFEIDGIAFSLDKTTPKTIFQPIPLETCGATGKVDNISSLEKMPYVNIEVLAGMSVKKIIFQSVDEQLLLTTPDFPYFVFKQGPPQGPPPAKRNPSPVPRSETWIPYSLSKPAFDFLKREKKITTEPKENCAEYLRKNGWKYAYGNTNYIPLYCYTPSSITSHLLEAPPGGIGGNGLGRADKVEAKKFKWCLISGNTSNEELKELVAKLGEDNRYVYSEHSKDFVRCNTPSNSFFLPFEIAYYRRTAIEKKEEKEYQKVIKTCTKNSPKVMGKSDKRLLNLPYDVNLFLRQKKDEPKPNVIKNKGNILSKAKGKRIDAGWVMKPIAGTTSATEFYVNLLKLPPPHPPLVESVALWSLKFLKQDYEITTSQVNQEWCHLLGHGDGGDEFIGNFVCGSYHCNTEQLAIETAQRQYTHLSPGKYRLHSTAYLLPNESLKEEHIDKYKSEYKDKGIYYKASIDGYIPVSTRGNPKSSEGDAGMTPAGSETQQPGKSLPGSDAPVAAFIRYKIYGDKNYKRGNPPAARRKAIAGGPAQPVAAGPNWVKIFDYTFEGQSEFFDANQYYIVYYSVKAAFAAFEKEINPEEQPASVGSGDSRGATGAATVALKRDRDSGDVSMTSVAKEQIPQC